MKPDWKNAPEWAKFLAQDLDGTWYWFEAQPIPCRDGMWRSEGGTKYEQALVMGHCEERP